MADDKNPQRLRDINAEKSVAWKDGEGKHLREGEKPSAPSNLVLPKPVVIPAPPTSSTKPGSEKK